MPKGDKLLKTISTVSIDNLPPFEEVRDALPLNKRILASLMVDGLKANEAIKKLKLTKYKKQIIGWLQEPDFLAFQEYLKFSLLERVRYIHMSKMQRSLDRLEELSEQDDDLSVSHKATMDMLSFMGVRSGSSSLNVNVFNLQDADNRIENSLGSRGNNSSLRGLDSVDDIDNEIDEIDNMLNKGDIIDAETIEQDSDTEIIDKE